jgi:hypothetical protein
VFHTCTKKSLTIAPARSARILAGNSGAKLPAPPYGALTLHTTLQSLPSNSVEFPCPVISNPVGALGLPVASPFIVILAVAGVVFFIPILFIEYTLM